MQDNKNVHPFSMANLGKFKNDPIYHKVLIQCGSFGLYYIENMIWFCHDFKIIKVRTIMGKHKNQAHKSLHEKRMDFFFYLGRFSNS